MKRFISFIYIIICISIIVFGFNIMRSNYNRGEKYMSVQGVDSEKSNVIKEIKSEDKIFIMKGEAGFSNGDFENTELSNDLIILSKSESNYEDSGLYISNVIDVDDFTNLIVSWNADTPEKTYVEIEARVLVEDRLNKSLNGEWSEWLSWGKWGTGIERSSSNTSCDIAKINTDVLTINEKENKIASKFQIRANLYTESEDVTPTITELTASYIDVNKSIETFNEKRYLEGYDKFIDTPSISQYLREESIAARICSPTSLTMILNRMGENLIVEDVAWKCYDYEYEGFGNWTFNTAYAGKLGYESYVAYGDIELLKREMDNGYPVAVSVKYTNDINNKKYPYIENAPTTTAGHLIVVCGITSNDEGEIYIVVNDPAGKDDESVTRKYKLDEFMAAWGTSNNAMYVINKR